MLGCCDNVLKAIFISETVSESYFHKILCHEIAHACLYSYRIKLNKNQEELIVDLIATYGEEIMQLTETVKNNYKGNLY